jgi:hypothetical protein
VNSLTTTRTYDSATRTTTTPAGRSAQTTTDAKGSVTRVQAGNLYPFRQSWDIFSRPTQIKYGPDPDTSDTRVTTIAYVDDFAVAFDGYPAEAIGQVKTTTDAAGQTTTYQYDDAGRVIA